MTLKVTRVLFLIAVLLSVIFLPSVAFAGNPPDAGNSTFSASPTSVPADGTTQSTITVTLQDSTPTPLVGDSVSLTAPSDATAVISPASAVLDSSGMATFTITSTTQGTDSIDVTDTTTTTTLSSFGNVDFTTPTSSSSQNSDNGNSANTSCGNASPPNAPNFYSLTSTKDTATLYFVQPSSPFDGYTISYGLDSNADKYNVSFNQGPSSTAINYVVNNLTPNTVYYFKVRANNGCAPGPWSSVLSTGKQTLPETGPSNLIYLGILGIALFLTGSSLLFRYK